MKKTIIRGEILLGLNFLFAIISVIVPHENLYVRGFLRIPVGLFFYTVGYFATIIKWNKKVCIQKVSIIVFIALALHILMTVLNGDVDMHGLVIGKNWFVYFVNGTITSLLIIYLCKMYANKKIKGLTWFGQNTMITLCTHQLVIELLWVIDNYSLHLLTIVGKMFQPWILIGVVLAINYPITLILNKYGDVLFGKK